MASLVSEVTIGQASEFIARLGRAGLTFAAFKRLLSDDEMASRVAAAFVSMSASSVYSITVDLTKSLSELIASGHYDWVNPDITPEHFQVTSATTPSGSGPLHTPATVELIHLNKVVSTEDVLADFNRRGLRPARIEELLALGTWRPDLQREFPIVALGSVWQYSGGGRIVPCLCGHVGGRGLDLLWAGCGWSERDRFLAVRK